MILAIGLLLLIHGLLLSHLTFTAWPEMISYSYLLNHGFLLYKDIAQPYEPLLTVFLAGVYRIFGYDLMVLKVVTWLFIFTADVLVFWLSFKLVGNRVVAFCLTLFYVIIQALFDGNGLWFDSACVPLILAGLSCLVSQSRRRYFCSGLCFGLAFLVKQQEVLLILGISSYWVVSRNFRKLGYFLLGMGIPIGVTLLLVSWWKVLDGYWFWTVVVPVYWYPKMPAYARFPTLHELFELMLIFGPAVGMVAVKFRKLTELGRLIIIVFGVTFLTAFPRFELFRLQPALAIFGLILAVVWNFKRRWIWIAPMVIGCIFFVKGHPINSATTNRFFDSQTAQVSQTVATLSQPGDSVYLLGVNSLVYVMAERLPPKPWVDNYVWYYEIPVVSDQAIAGFAHDRPKLVLWQLPQSGNWFDLGTYQSPKLVSYLRQHYQKIGQVTPELEIWQIKK